MAAMLDYMLREKGLKIEELPGFDPSVFIGDLSQTPEMAKAPVFIKDSLMFPYFSGMNFSLAMLKPDGWPGFAAVFAKPPANTQQIMHPELYRTGKVPDPIKLDQPANFPGMQWTLLEQNSMGEFGWQEVLKQFLGEERAKGLSSQWNGDVYATYENKSKHTLLITRLRLSDDLTAARFFGQYSVALEKKSPKRSALLRRSNYFSFETLDGVTVLRCFKQECITFEGGSRAEFLDWYKQLGWPALPDEPQTAPPDVTTTERFCGKDIAGLFDACGLLPVYRAALIALPFAHNSI